MGLLPRISDSKRLDPTLPRLLIAGHGRSGKDTMGEWLEEHTPLKYGGSTSEHLAPFVAARQGVDVMEAFRARHEHRQLWWDTGCEIRSDDPACLVRKVLEGGHLVVGNRQTCEVRAAKATGLIDLAIWVDRDVPPDPTQEFGPEECDLVIPNRWDIPAFHDRIARLMRSLGVPVYHDGTDLAEGRWGGWVETFTGKHFFPLDPDPEAVDILDITHALACLNRFTGHTRQPLSIAQHSVLVASLLPPELKLWGLLHDASEAYVNDVARPLKHHLAFRAYRKAETALMEVIAHKFGLSWPEPPEVKAADNVVLKAETKALIHGGGKGWGDWFAGIPDVPATTELRITPTWPWSMAERIFLAHFEHYRKQAA